ncbi:MAG: hypothetical protein JSV91_08280 [Phycisphaerales bacterium]|nr:MAG: hypothetical protein JSV91_08280 [Phycisphaerales bacterium]
MLRKHSRIVRVLGLGVVLMVVGSTGWTLGQIRSDNAADSTLDARFSFAWLELAQANLDKARASGAPAYVAVVHEEAVRNFRDAYEKAQAGQPLTSYQALLTTMDHLSNIAERRLRAAEALRESYPDAIDEYELRRLKSKYEILKIGAGLGHEISSASPEEQVEWQLRQLRSLQLLVADHLFHEGL